MSGKGSLFARRSTSLIWPPRISERLKRTNGGIVTPFIRDDAAVCLEKIFRTGGNSDVRQTWGSIAVTGISETVSAGESILSFLLNRLFLFSSCFFFLNSSFFLLSPL